MENCTEIIHFETWAWSWSWTWKALWTRGQNTQTGLGGRALGISWKTQRHGKLEKGPHTETLLYMSKFT